MHMAMPCASRTRYALNLPVISALDYLSSRYPPSLTVKQVGEITSESVDSIRGALSRGQYAIPSFKIGNKRVFRLTDVAAYLDQQFAAANGPAAAQPHNQPVREQQQVARRKAQGVR